MLTIACVWKTGGDYTVGEVENLSACLSRNVGIDHQLVCLTDEPRSLGESVDVAIPLISDWPGWWSKMEIFRLTPPVLYFDLDTFIRADITALCLEVEQLTKKVLMLRDFYHGNEASGIMGWNQDLSWLTDAFASYAKENKFVPMQTRDYSFYRCGAYRGDQDFIREQIRNRAIPVKFAQDALKGIYSYKVDVQPSGKTPADASIVCFHGRPRPWEVDLTEDGQ